MGDSIQTAWTTELKKMEQSWGAAISSAVSDVSDTRSTMLTDQLQVRSQ